MLFPALHSGREHRNTSGPLSMSCEPGWGLPELELLQVAGEGVYDAVLILTFTVYNLKYCYVL